MVSLCLPIESLCIYTTFILTHANYQNNHQLEMPYHLGSSRAHVFSHDVNNQQEFNQISCVSKAIPLTISTLCPHIVCSQPSSMNLHNVTTNSHKNPQLHWQTLPLLIITANIRYVMINPQSVDHLFDLDILKTKISTLVEYFFANAIKYLTYVILNKHKLGTKQPPVPLDQTIPPTLPFGGPQQKIGQRTMPHLHFHMRM